MFGSCADKIPCSFFMHIIVVGALRRFAVGQLQSPDRDSPTVETALWHSSKGSPGVILSHSLDNACDSIYCSIIWGLPELRHFTLFPLSNVIMEMDLFSTSEWPNRWEGYRL